MPRKTRSSNTTTTSAVPFTTFAAVTAQALSNSADVASSWETDSLTILRKLSKKDTTTKLKALQELDTHLNTLPSNAPLFLSAFCARFRSMALHDESAAVRAELYKMVEHIARTMRKNMQASLGEVLPAWIAGLGDEVESVRRAAEGVERIVGEKKDKVIKKYRGELKTFCKEEEGRAVVAVLKWMVEGGEDVWDILDEQLGRLGKEAGEEVCALMVEIVQREQGERREVLEMGLRGIKEGVMGGWDVVLTVITKGWAVDWKRVADVTKEALTRETPSGVEVLLALVGVLRERDEGEDVIRKVLTGVRDRLLLGRVGYNLAVLEAYLECVEVLIGRYEWVEKELILPVVGSFCEEGIVGGRMEKIGERMGRVLDGCGEEVVREIASSGGERIEAVIRGMKGGELVKEVVKRGCEKEDVGKVVRALRIWKSEEKASKELTEAVLRMKGGEEERGEIVSWLYWGGREAEEVDTAVWKEALKAHTRRKEWRGWRAMQMDEVVREALSKWEESDVALIVEAVRVDGGGVVGIEVLKEVVDEVVKRKEVDEVIIALLSDVSRLGKGEQVTRLVQKAALSENEKVQEALVMAMSGLEDAEELATRVIDKVKEELPEHCAQTVARVVTGIEPCQRLCEAVLRLQNAEYTRVLLQHVSLSRAFSSEEESVELMLSVLPLVESPERLVIEYEHKQQLLQLAVQWSVRGEEGLQHVLQGVQLDELSLQDVCTDLVSVLKSGKTQHILRIPAIVRALRKRSDHFEALIQQAVTFVRRDPYSLVAAACIDILAGLMNPDAPQWLIQAVQTVLLAVRRGLERTIGVDKGAVQRLEGSAAGLVAVADVGEDDVRFWRIRVEDGLKAEVRGERGELERLGNFLMVGNKLVTGNADRILHFAAWSAVRYLSEGVREEVFEGCEQVVVKAVGAGVLMGGGVTVPVEMEAVYELIGVLGAEHGGRRRASLTLVSFALAVDVVERVEKLGEEEWKVEEVEGVIPKKLREGMEGEGELGVFGCWRVFLELIGGGEGKSFRNVAIEYLREKHEVFKAFLVHVIEVVVNGSARERMAATEAAMRALGGDVEEVGSGDMQGEVGKAAGIALARALQRLPALSRQCVEGMERGLVGKLESFVRSKIAPLLIREEIDKVKEWGAFGGGKEDGIVHARGSVSGREVCATYTFSDKTLEIGIRMPDVFPLGVVQVEARTGSGMTEARWRKTLLGMTMLLRVRDGSLAEAVELWRRNLDRTFEGKEECPICYSVLHLTTAQLPKMRCKTCKHLFHSECLVKWFAKSAGSACPMCRSAFVQGR